MQLVLSAVRGYTKHYQGLSKPVWQAVLLTLLESIAGGVSFVLSLYLVNTLHFSIEKAGYLIACYGIGTAIGGLLSGRLSDHISPRYITISCIFLHAFLYWILVHSHQFLALALNLFLMGICSYGVITSNRIWIMKHCGSDNALRMQSLNISYAASNLGMGISGALIGIFAAQGMQVLFQFVAVVLFLAGIMLLFQSKELPITTHHSTIIQSNKTTHRYADLKIFLLILICLCGAGFYVSQSATTYNVYIENTFPTWGLHGISILAVINTLAIVFFQAPLVTVLKKYNKLIIAGLGVFLMGFGYLLLNFTFHFFAIAVIACLVYVLGEMLFFSVAQIICYEKVSEKRKGQAVGIYQAVYSISRVAGPATGGLIYQYAGANQLWWLSAVIGFVLLTACLYYRKDV